MSDEHGRAGTDIRQRTEGRDMNIVFSSCGNDSVALIQHCINAGLRDITVAYSDTQWSAEEWAYRVERVKWLCQQAGAKFVTIESEGFNALAKRKQAFPANGMAFCSFELKIKPAMAWLATVDPDCTATCFTGVMRCESEARKDWPLVVAESPNHGGRRLESPLADKTVTYRDEMLAQAGFDVLPHRSLECSPCVNANMRDIQNLTPEDVIKVVNLEAEMGVGKVSGKQKYMFRPHRMGDAKGMAEVKQRADRGGGSFDPSQEDLFGCDSGFCGS